MDNHIPKIQQAPFIVTLHCGAKKSVTRFGVIGRFPGTAEYIYTLFPGKLLYMLFKTRQMGIARNSGNDKKIRPEIQIPHIHYHHINSPVFFQELSQIQGEKLYIFTL